ncbi:MAG: IS3 family transposase [Kineosporiaceae bacterium]|nr:IS3 family transposase [Kineosporiaceae bacterium]
MQRELLDRRQWATRDELATAMFEWIEAFYNPVRRHSALDYLSPVEYEAQYWATLAPQAAEPAACTTHPTCPGNRVKLPRLRAARLDHTLDAEFRRLARLDLLIIDDFALKAWTR